MMRSTKIKYLTDRGDEDTKPTYKEDMCYR